VKNHTDSKKVVTYASGHRRWRRNGHDGNAGIGRLRTARGTRVSYTLRLGQKRGQKAWHTDDRPMGCVSKAEREGGRGRTGGEARIDMRAE